MKKYIGFLSVLLFSANLIFANSYSIDKSHSTVGFKVTHMVIAKVDGKFTDYNVTFNFDENDLNTFNLDVAVKINSVNTENEKRDGHLQSSDFFDSATYPEMTYRSSKLTKTKKGFVSHGTLTIRGTSKNIELPFTVKGPIVDPWGNSRIAVEASTTINRKEYGLNWNKTMDKGGLVVSDDVEIIINAEFIKS